MIPGARADARRCRRGHAAGLVSRRRARRAAGGCGNCARRRGGGAGQRAARTPPPRGRRPATSASPSAARSTVSRSTWRPAARRGGSRCSARPGSGKSLTLRALAGLDRATGDRLRLDGQDLSATPPEGRGIAYVPQSYGLFPHLTAERQLRFAVDHDPARAAFWFRRLGLTGLERRMPGELSVGQQQRVAIARAFSRPAAPAAARRTLFGLGHAAPRSTATGAAAPSGRGRGDDHPRHA